MPAREQDEKRIKTRQKTFFYNLFLLVFSSSLFSLAKVSHTRLFSTKTARTKNHQVVSFGDKA